MNQDEALEAQVLAQVRMAQSAQALLTDAVVGLRDIPVMPLKGMWLRQLAYEHPMQRLMSDVDLLIPPARLGQALERLHETGDFLLEYEAEHAVTLRHLPSGVYLDLHRTLFAYGLFNMPTKQIIRRGAVWVLHGQRVLKMQPVDVYAHLIGHMATARKSAATTRDQKDMWSLAGMLDPELCADAIRRYGLLHAASYVLPMFEDAFSRSVQDALGPPSAWRASVARWSFSKGTRGTGPALVMHALVGNAGTLRAHLHYVRAQRSGKGQARLARLAEHRARSGEGARREGR